MLRKFVLATLLTLSASVAALPAHAQDLVGAQDPAPKTHEHKEHKWDPAKMEEFRQKHLAKEKELLHITPAQEAAWKTFTEKTKPAPPPPHQDRAQMEKLTEPERMEKMLGHFKQMEAHMQAHLSALKEFYAQLSPEQKTIFELTHKHHRGGHWSHRGHGHEGHRGHEGHDGHKGPGGPGGPGGHHPMEVDGDDDAAAE